MQVGVASATNQPDFVNFAGFVQFIFGEPRNYAEVNVGNSAYNAHRDPDPTGDVQVHEHT